MSPLGPRGAQGPGEAPGPQRHFVAFVKIFLPFWEPGGIPEGSWRPWLRPDEVSAQTEAPGPDSLKF